MSEGTASFAKAREDFLAMVEEVRPELHRYCARLTGSVIEGEDIVQDTMARALYALSMTPEVPPLRPWLFRIAHNAAIDFLKSHGKKYTETRADILEVADLHRADEPPDPAALRAALARFLVLPVSQRSAVILKDVLGHSLAETAETMGTTVLAVKAALVRGRNTLRETAIDDAGGSLASRAELDRYASLFNARDWDGLRALVSDECHLDLVSKSQRRGKEVGMYFARYDREQVRLRVARLDGELVLAAYVEEQATPSYLVVLGWSEGRVVSIRDFRYVSYIAREAAFEID
jgi:RNA polymerase sigma factor (sigma-70 family)